MTSSASSRRGTDSDAVTRQAFLPFSSIRLARSGSAPFGSVRRDLRAISVNRVAPSLRSTIPLPDTSSVRKLNLEASATARASQRTRDYGPLVGMGGCAGIVEDWAALEGGVGRSLNGCTSGGGRNF